MQPTDDMTHDDTLKSFQIAQIGCILFGYFETPCQVLDQFLDCGHITALKGGF